MKLWEMHDPNAEVVLTLESKRDNPKMALVETAIEHNLNVSDVVRIYKVHLLMNNKK